MSNFYGNNMPPMFNPNVAGLTGSQVVQERGTKLFLFPPRQLTKQVKRPLTYNFTGEFVDRAEHAINQSIIRNDQRPLQQLCQSNDVTQVMIPSASSSFIIELDRLSSNWTFMMTVDNEPFGSNLISQFSPNSDNRTLYYGYFVDEPVNPFTGGTTVNPNAQLIITHKTAVNRLAIHGSQGMRTRDDTVADIDIIPRMTAMLARETTYTMRPIDLFQNSSVGSDGITMYESDYDQLANQPNPIDMNASLLVPRTNVQKVIGSLYDNATQLNAQMRSGTLVPFDQTGDLTYANLSNNLHNTPVLAHTGLDVHTVNTLGNIVSRYNPTIVNVDTPQAVLFDRMDQGVTSKRVVFSSLITSILPVIMSNMGLMGIAFTYDSHHDALQFDDAPESMMPTADMELVARAHGVVNKMKADIFGMMKQTGGDFYLVCRCSCGGMTHCSLNFYDDEIRDRAVYEVPTVLGGLNNNLIGNSRAMNHNCEQFGLLVNALTDTGDRNIPFSLYDEMAGRHQEHINQHDHMAYPTQPNYNDPFTPSPMGYDAPPMGVTNSPGYVPGPTQIPHEQIPTPGNNVSANKPTRKSWLQS